MTNLHDLLARVEQATGPDRELDVAINCALFPGLFGAEEAIAYVHGQYVIDRGVARVLLASKTTITPQDPTP